MNAIINWRTRAERIGRDRSRLKKRSMVIAGRKTSLTLEDPFWDGLRLIARGRAMTPGALVAEIDARHSASGLCAAIRLHVLDYYKSRALVLRAPKGDAA
jgi:predicted DNA-binding ribbon-helix-helix protein